MESNHDPFIFATEMQDETDTLEAIHCNIMPADGILQSDFCEPLLYDDHLVQDAANDWSNLQSTLIDTSPSSRCSNSHEEMTSIFEQSYWSQPQLSGITPASGSGGGGISDELFDTMSFSAPDAIAITNDKLHEYGDMSGCSPELAVRMTKQSLRALKDWKIQHGETIKPTRHDISQLQKQTGLSPEQIRNWFSHSKRRNEAFGGGGAASHRAGGMLSALSLELSAASTVENIPARPPTPTVRDILYTPATPLEDMCPMERWENSPPEHEAALVSDIAKALSHSDTQYYNASCTSTRSASRGDSVSTGSSIQDRHPDPSDSSIDSDIFDSAAWSEHSGQSTHSGRSSTTEYRRRARKRRTNPLLRGSNILRGDIPKTFQCTFCTDSFKTKYDWSRHEKSLHLALESWTCSPFGSIIQEPEDGSQPKCAYCNAPSPTEDHLRTHRYLACDDRPLSERTYYRKDHLRQHLRLVHGCRFTPSMSKWKRTPEYVRSRCGFCDQQLTTWQGRIDHLASHFRAGHTMANWSGGWGFEPHISRLIENSMPPFLIHHERSTVSPFSGSISISIPSARKQDSHQERTSSMSTGSEKIYSSQYTYPATQALSCFDSFEAQLVTYINATLAEEGRLPSDTEIQDQARRFVYDGDDPWHQTIAENAMWLEDFKERYAFVAPVKTCV
ncbi:hypothetical protein UA08_01816 [Talaromyces atroroseus]|uniref:C2H2-type domain-containing protein n=1 Tax=Talaromyces atroroseus TaxID=1441469 RepID=A0A1Q5QA83_TALAT|nr:hypothetical protein UA08_01816 [Talaromyces atroroseus]OKL62846.1 hypothetical protein UA08_01816 [Talaromyces atroroseus]